MLVFSVQPLPAVLLGIFILLSSLSTILAVSFSSRNIETRTVSGIYMCSKENWQGNCKWQQVTLKERINGGSCIHLHNEGGIRSLGPDRSIGLTLYASEGCNENTMVTKLCCPGWADLILFSDRMDVKKLDLWAFIEDIDPNKVLPGCPK
jgi:hypothetical protein